MSPGNGIELLREGIAAAQAGEGPRAYDLVEQATRAMPYNEIAWLWLASLASDLETAREALHKVLELHPGHEKASRWLDKLERRSQRKSGLRAKSAEPAGRPPENPPATSLKNLATREVSVEVLEKGATDERDGGGNRTHAANGLGFRDSGRERGRKVILVIDDSPTVRKLVAMTLERRSYRVMVAADGMEGLAKLQEAVPDLILLDINMPHLDGYKLCRVIKDNDLTRRVPVVMLSGNDGFLDKVRGRMAGAADYITKPVEPGQLVRSVEKHFQPVIEAH